MAGLKMKKCHDNVKLNRLSTVVYFIIGIVVCFDVTCYK